MKQKTKEERKNGIKEENFFDQEKREIDFANAAGTSSSVPKKGYAELVPTNNPSEEKRYYFS